MLTRVLARYAPIRQRMAGEASYGMLRIGRLRNGMAGKVCFVQASCGKSGRGMVRQRMAGKARCGAVRQCLDRFGVAGKFRYVMGRYGGLWKGVAGKVWRSMVSRGEAAHGKVRYGLARYGWQGSQIIYNRTNRRKEYETVRMEETRHGNMLRTGSR